MPSIYETAPLSEEHGITIISFTLQHNTTGSWSWLKDKFGTEARNAACSLHLYGLLFYRKLASFSSNGVGELSGVSHVETEIEVEKKMVKKVAFMGVRCYTKPAWRLADGKYGNDGESVSIIIGCLILKTDPRHQNLCALISDNRMKLRLSLSNESSHDRLYSKTTTHVEGAELRNTVTTDLKQHRYNHSI